MAETKVLAILSEKGGAGKTTVTVHLAVAAELAGLDVAIVDLDPQASAADWCDRRGNSPEAVAIPPARLEKLLAEVRAQGMHLVIIDTGRDSNNAGYTAAQAADLVLIPCRGGGFYVRALARTLDLCRIANKRPFLILNAMRPGATRAEADARDALASESLEIAPVVLHERAAYKAASITTKTAQEAEPDSAASSEISQLYSWISRQLGLSTIPQRNKKRKSAA